MVRKPDCQCNDRQRRIGETGCREDRTAGHVQVLRFVDSTVLVYYAASCIGSHPSRAEMMKVADDHGRRAFVAELANNPTDARLSQPGIDEVDSSADGTEVLLGDSPVQPRPRQPHQPSSTLYPHS